MKFWVPLHPGWGTIRRQKQVHLREPGALFGKVPGAQPPVLTPSAGRGGAKGSTLGGTRQPETPARGKVLPGLSLHARRHLIPPGPDGTPGSPGLQQTGHGWERGAGSPAPGGGGGGGGEDNSAGSTFRVP